MSFVKKSYELDTTFILRASIFDNVVITLAGLSK